MSKQLTINLGGQERILNVGKFWFTKFYGEATGSDPLNSTDILLKPEQQFDFVVATVYAGLRTSYKAEKKAEDFTFEDVQNWVGEKEDEEISVFLKDYGAISKKEPGEAETQAGNP